MKLLPLTILVSSVIASCLTGCRNHSESAVITGDTLTHEAHLLTMIRTDSYIMAEVLDPWNQGNILGRYMLVDSAHTAPDSIPAGTTVIRVPLTNSTVYSSVHAGIIEELGALGSITGVADGSYFNMPSIISGITDGTITDIGSSMSPSLEKLIKLSPDAILTSPYQNAGHGLIDKTGSPIVECADYMESTPLGRAEWIKLMGALYGRYDRAAEIFDSVAVRYNTLKSIAANEERRPKVISESVTDGVWYVPGGNSYMAAMFADAGGDYPWSDDTSTGSLQLDYPAVYARAADADIWLIRTYGYDLTLDNLASQYPLNKKIRAYGTGGVYAANTATSTLFEDFPFHPERLLHEYINIMHPGLLPDSTLHYYRLVK